MAKLRVLVVDDAAFIREMVKKTIRTRFPDFQVEDAVNGRKAQQLMLKGDYDLVLCDWEMPEMSGIELLTWVRQERKSRVPFVMVTSRGDKANVVEAIQAGVTDYIGKPFSNEGLLNKVIKVLGKHHNLRTDSRSSGAGRVADGSIDALTGGAKAKQTPTRQPQKPTPTAAQASPKAAPPKMPKPATVRGSAHLRFGSTISACDITALSLKQIVLQCKVSQGLPAILENVVVDLEQPGSQENSEVARLNAIVHTLQAQDTSPDCELVSVTVTIVDQDPQKLAYMSKMIARGTTQSGFIPAAN
ncbi:response regulator [Motiliproteus sp.]|uniref:response regulator n=1 Tax=Motiliproteus sp. TaxID=1898955 RepID=UPI003BAAC33A